MNNYFLFQKKKVIKNLYNINLKKIQSKKHQFNSFFIAFFFVVVVIVTIILKKLISCESVRSLARSLYLKYKKKRFYYYVNTVNERILFLIYIIKL